MKNRQKRFSFIGLGLLLIAGAAALVLSAFEDNIVFFHSHEHRNAAYFFITVGYRFAHK